MKFFIVYLLVMNIATFVIFGLDKAKAKKDKWRIPEATLIILCIAGGSIGGLAAMFAFHHKTRKNKFRIGVPLILVLQAALLVYIFVIR